MKGIKLIIFGTLSIIFSLIGMGSTVVTVMYLHNNPIDFSYIFAALILALIFLVLTKRELKKQMNDDVKKVIDDYIKNLN